jgi:anti-sigma factor RsiW
MSNHLSEDQIAKCIAGQPAASERQHIEACTACRVELERFDQAVSMFRRAIEGCVGRRIASGPAAATALRPPAGLRRMWRWALIAAAALLLIIVPLLRSRTELPQQVDEPAAPMDADTLMRAVNLHLSRTVPAPMEPVLALIPNEEHNTESGGLQ